MLGQGSGGENYSRAQYGQCVYLHELPLMCVPYSSFHGRLYPGGAAMATEYAPVASFSLE